MVCVHVCLHTHICIWCGYALMPLPSRKFHVWFWLISILTTGPALTQGCRRWSSPTCQDSLLASEIFTPLTELSDFCPQTKWAHKLNFPPSGPEASALNQLSKVVQVSGSVPAKAKREGNSSSMIPQTPNKDGVTFKLVKHPSLEGSNRDGVERPEVRACKRVKP